MIFQSLVAKSAFVIFILTNTGLLFCHRATGQTDVIIRINMAHPGYELSQDMYGIFFEDINHASDGWLYAELIQNRDFEYNCAPADMWWFNDSTIVNEVSGRLRCWRGNTWKPYSVEADYWGYCCTTRSLESLRIPFNRRAGFSRVPATLRRSSCCAFICNQCRHVVSGAGWRSWLAWNAMLMW